MIKYIQLFAERCTGSNYLTRLIEYNFKVKITWQYGWKHWYINYDLCKDQEDTLFVILVRNPYDQIRSMYITPHHAPTLTNISFSTFIRKEWQSEDHNKDVFEIENNIQTLLSKKMKNFVGLKWVVKNFILFRYEDIKENISILRELNTEFQIEMKSNEIVNINEYKQTKNLYIPKKYNEINEEDIKFINESLDWEIYNELGYIEKEIID